MDANNERVERARAKLRLGAGGGTETNRWFAENEEALILVEQWLDMKPRGETDWTPARLYRELVGEHGFPYKSPSTLLNWFNGYRRDEYDRAKRGR